MIELQESDFVASGLFCKCYGHPQQSELCVKVVTDNQKARKRLRVDLRYYHKLHKRKVDLSYIADYLGTCDTNQGQGYLYQCVRDHNGEVSQTLASYLEESENLSEEVLGALGKLAQYLVHNGILISDLHSRNVLLQKDADGGIKPIIVDGIGDRVGIPILNVFPHLVRAKIVRRWNRFAKKELDSQVLLDE